MVGKKWEGNCPWWEKGNCPEFECHRHTYQDTYQSDLQPYAKLILSSNGAHLWVLVIKSGEIIFLSVKRK